MRSAPRCRPDWIVATVLGAISLVLVFRIPPLPDYEPDSTRAATSPPVHRGGAETLRVQDFAYIFNYARFAAHRRAVSPYSVPEHRRFLDEWMGPYVTSALCFAYSPTMVLVLAPLFAVSTRWAWLVWNLVGGWLAALAFRSTAGDESRLRNLGRLTLVSPAVFHTLVLGQTALVTTGLLALTILFAWRSTWIAASCLFALTMKPQLALVGSAALIAARCWKPLLVATAAVVVVLGGAIAWWSGAILYDYAVLIGNYNLVDAPLLFRAGFHPEGMTNLRNVLLYAGLDDAAASRLSNIPLAAGLAFPSVLSLVRRHPLPLEPAAAWVVSSYTLFSPHLSVTEDLVLVPVAFWLWRAYAAPGRCLLAGLIVGLQLVGGSTLVILTELGLLARGVPAPLFLFCAKVVVAALAFRTILAAVPPAPRQDSWSLRTAVTPGMST